MASNNFSRALEELFNACNISNLKFLPQYSPFEKRTYWEFERLDEPQTFLGENLFLISLVAGFFLCIVGLRFFYKNNKISISNAFLIIFDFILIRISSSFALEIKRIKSEYFHSVWNIFSFVLILLVGIFLAFFLSKSFLVINNP